MILPARLPVANLPTPIQKLERLSRELGKEIYIWRDDLTGFIESGNKVRKLEFLLHDALARKSTRVITCGGAQSNHTRAVSFLARKLGLEVTLVVRAPKQGFEPSEPPTGNHLLNQITGADLNYISYEAYRAAGAIYQPFLEATAAASRQRGETPYIISEGGSVPLGCFGYINAVEELRESWARTSAAAKEGAELPDSLFFAVGSGGTHAGLYLGYALNHWPVSGLWAVNVCDSAEYFQNRVGRLIQETIQLYNLPMEQTAPDLQILDGHYGEGYGIASDEDLAFYVELARLEGILLDPVYTGKAFRGMLAELKRTPEKFGETILFLHSGGIFGTFAYARQYGRVLGNSIPKAVTP